MEYQYLKIRKEEDSYIISSEVYKFHIEFSYDEEGTLQLHSYFGPGISLDMLDELEQLVMEEFEEDFKDCEENSENIVEFDEELIQLADDAAKKGDAIAQEVVDKYIEYVADGLVGVINIFQPEKLVISGGISKEGEYLLAPVRKIVEQERYTRYCKQTELKTATLGGDAGIIGAAMLGK